MADPRDPIRPLIWLTGGTIAATAAALGHHLIGTPGLLIGITVAVAAGLATDRITNHLAAAPEAEPAPPAALDAEAQDAADRGRSR